MYMQMARAAATRATCYRLNVGAVLVHGRNVIAIGYNGAPSGESHCTGNGCRYFTPLGCKVVHAETNVLSRAKHRIGCDLYVTHSPCSDCASRIAEGYVVSRVFFETAYRDPAPVKMLLDTGRPVYQLLPSGMLVDQRTGELVEAPE